MKKKKSLDEDEDFGLYQIKMKQMKKRIWIAIKYKIFIHLKIRGEEDKKKKNFICGGVKNNHVAVFFFFFLSKKKIVANRCSIIL